MSETRTSMLWRVRRRLAHFLFPPPPPKATPPPRVFEERFSSNLAVGERTVFLPSAHYEQYPSPDDKAHLFFGSDCMIGARFILESNQARVQVGDRSYISPGTTLTAREAITIGSDVMISWQVQIIDHDGHALNWAQRRADILQQNADHRAGKNFRTSKDWSQVICKPISIGDKVWIGFGSSILKGVTIGEGAIIGAQSVVTRDIEAWTIVAGNPARVVKQLDES